MLAGIGDRNVYRDRIAIEATLRMLHTSGPGFEDGVGRLDGVRI